MPDKNSSSLFFDIIRHAPQGARLRLCRSLFSENRPSTAENCEFTSPATFDEDYARLADLLGEKGRVPATGELNFLTKMSHRPVQHPGVICWTDYFFLAAFVSILSPKRVVEIGTLTGFSAAIIAATLERRRGSGEAAWVDTIDLRAQCVIDETRPTGFEIPELIPEIASLVRLHVPHDSSYVAELAQPNELDLAFIDANHRHPRPLLDLLRLAPSMRGAGWIVLHDIQLGTIARKAAATGEPLRWGEAFGAEWLFANWPFRKISGGNIGAVQVPAEKRQLISVALQLMRMPFEIEGTPGTRVRIALFESLARL